MLDMPRAVGPTEGTHGEQTDSDETIPDGGRDLFECDGKHYLSLQDSILPIVWRSFKTFIVIFALNQTHSNAFPLSEILSFMIALQQTKLRRH